jgi:hypothetical protein
MFFTYLKLHFTNYIKDIPFSDIGMEHHIPDYNNDHIVNQLNIIVSGV